jgi:hypothetical protein
VDVGFEGGVAVGGAEEALGEYVGADLVQRPGLVLAAQRLCFAAD